MFYDLMISDTKTLYVKFLEPVPSCWVNFEIDSTPVGSDDYWEFKIGLTLVSIRLFEFKITDVRRCVE